MDERPSQNGILFNLTLKEIPKKYLNKELKIMIRVKQ